jgi:hypothetical protein
MSTVNGQAQINTATAQPYVRPSRFELEPAVFTVALVAVVMSICTWNPVVTEQQQAAPVDGGSTVVQASRG